MKHRNSWPTLYKKTKFTEVTKKNIKQNIITLQIIMNNYNLFCIIYSHIHRRKGTIIQTNTAALLPGQTHKCTLG